MYDADGNYVGEEEEEEKPKKKKTVKKRRAKRTAAEMDETSEPEDNVDPAVTVSPFADLSEVELVSSTTTLLREEDKEVCADFNNDRLGDSAQSKQVVTEEDRKRQAAERKRREEYNAKMDALSSAKSRERKEQQKQRKAEPHPMGHFSNSSSDKNGLIFDGIYQWTSMGLGKTPLKVKKQWKGENDSLAGNQKRNRKNLQLPRD